MPWTKTCVDNIIDVKRENKCSVGSLLIVLDKIACIFNELRVLSIKLDNDLSKLREQVDAEGHQTDSFGNVIPYNSSVAEYNALIQQFVFNIATFLKFKVPSECGLASYLIKQWLIDSQVTIYSLNFKMHCYNWVNCSKVCIVDNISLIDPPVLTAGTFPNFLIDTFETINIGSSVITLPFVENEANVSGVLAPTSLLLFANFRILLCGQVSDQLHLLNALFCKNIEIIERCIKNIHLITEGCDLICCE